MRWVLLLLLLASPVVAQDFVEVFEGSGAAPSCTIPDTPVARWRFEEGSGSTPLDETANNNDFSDSSCAQDSTNFIEGSSARDCTGSENLSITDANLTSIPGQDGSSDSGWTVVGHYRPNTIDASFRRGLFMSDWSLAINSSDQWECFIRTTAGDGVAVAASNGTTIDHPSADTYHCVACSWADDGDDKLRICVDSGSGVGCGDSSQTTSGTMDTSTNGLFFMSNNSPSQQFDGQGDHVAIWNVQLTDSEIQDYCDCTDGS